MSEKSDLRDTIYYCNQRIGIIEQDITDMENYKTNIVRYRINILYSKNDVNAFDVTLGETWKQNLCDDALEYKKDVDDSIDSALETISNLCNELDTCMENARTEIQNLRDTISRCEARIAEIERAEEEAARRQAEQAQR